MGDNPSMGGAIRSGAVTRARSEPVSTAAMPGCAARGIGVDANDPCVGVRAADERGVQQARHGEIADVAAAPEDQLLRLARAQRRADVGHGRS